MGIYDRAFKLCFRHFNLLRVISSLFCDKCHLFMLSLLPKMPRAELVKKLVKLHHVEIELFFLPYNYLPR